MREVPTGFLSGDVPESAWLSWIEGRASTSAAWRWTCLRGLSTTPWITRPAAASRITMICPARRSGIILSTAISAPPKTMASQLLRRNWRFLKSSPVTTGWRRWKSSPAGRTPSRTVSRTSFCRDGKWSGSEGTNPKRMQLLQQVKRQPMRKALLQPLRMIP